MSQEAPNGTPDKTEETSEHSAAGDSTSTSAVTPTPGEGENSHKVAASWTAAEDNTHPKPLITPKPESVKESNAVPPTPTQKTGDTSVVPQKPAGSQTSSQDNYPKLLIAQKPEPVKDFAVVLSTLTQKTGDTSVVPQKAAGSQTSAQDNTQTRAHAEPKPLQPSPVSPPPPPQGLAETSEVYHPQTQKIQRSPADNKSPTSANAVQAGATQKDLKLDKATKGHGEKSQDLTHVTNGEERHNQGTAKCEPAAKQLAAESEPPRSQKPPRPPPPEVLPGSKMKKLKPEARYRVLFLSWQVSEEAFEMIQHLSGTKISDGSYIELTSPESSEEWITKVDESSIVIFYSSPSAPGPLYQLDRYLEYSVSKKGPKKVIVVVGDADSMGPEWKAKIEQNPFSRSLDPFYVSRQELDWLPKAKLLQESLEKITRLHYALTGHAGFKGNLSGNGALKPKPHIEEKKEGRPKAKEKLKHLAEKSKRNTEKIHPGIRHTVGFVTWSAEKPGEWLRSHLTSQYFLDIKYIDVRNTSVEDVTDRISGIPSLIIYFTKESLATLSDVQFLSQSDNKKLIAVIGDLDETDWEEAKELYKKSPIKELVRDYFMFRKEDAETFRTWDQQVHERINKKWQQLMSMVDERIVLPDSPRKLGIITIFSRSAESDYAWLGRLLKSSKLQVSGGDIRSLYISNRGYQEFFEAVNRCDFGILYHTKNRGRINITDVTDSLYDFELEYLSTALGRSNVLVIIDDLQDNSRKERSRIVGSQPKILKYSRNVWLVTGEEKKDEDKLLKTLEHELFCPMMEETDEEKKNPDSPPPNNDKSLKQPVGATNCKPPSSNDTHQSPICVLQSIAPGTQVPPAKDYTSSITDSPPTSGKPGLGATSPLSRKEDPNPMTTGQSAGNPVISRVVTTAGSAPLTNCTTLSNISPEAPTAAKNSATKSGPDAASNGDPNPPKHTAVVLPDSPRKLGVITIFSRSAESDYAWLGRLLKSSKLQVSGGDIRSFYISNRGYQEFYEAVNRCDFGILYHTKNRGRINITDVTDSLYDFEIEYLSTALGRSNVLVIIDDLQDNSRKEKSRIVGSQPKILKYSRNVWLVTGEEKKDEEKLLKTMKYELFCPMMVETDEDEEKKDNPASPPPNSDKSLKQPVDATKNKPPSTEDINKSSTKVLPAKDNTSSSINSTPKPSLGVTSPHSRKGELNPETTGQSAGNPVIRSVAPTAGSAPLTDETCTAISNISSVSPTGTKNSKTKSGSDAANNGDPDPPENAAAKKSDTEELVYDTRL